MQLPTCCHILLILVTGLTITDWHEQVETVSSTKHHEYNHRAVGRGWRFGVAGDFPLVIQVASDGS